MKKAVSILLVGMLVLAMGASTAFAQTASQGTSFVDENKDGICDLCGGKDEDGDGVCDNCPNDGTRPLNGTGRRLGCGNGNRGNRFVDANGDGICDNRSNTGRGNRGQGCARNNGNGNGRGRMGK